MKVSKTSIEHVDFSTSFFLLKYGYDLKMLIKTFNELKFGLILNFPTEMNANTLKTNP